MKDLTPRIILRLVAATIVLTVVTSVVMTIPAWQGPQASAEAADIDTLLTVMIILSSFVFSVVIVMMGYAIWRYRAKPGDESDGEPIHGNTRLEVIWTVIPTIIVLFAGIYSWIVLDNIEGEAAAGDRMRVNVTAQQFAWRFDYVDADKTSTELHVPSGTQLELHLNALDVIHSFWVPEWRIKRDLVPGSMVDGEAGNPHIDNVVRVTPTEEGTYSVVCTELCGLGHATMRAAAVVESQEEFDRWLADQSEIPEGKVSTGAAGGRGAGALAE
jgi:cytochrome c oxidase subunit II